MRQTSGASSASGRVTRGSGELAACRTKRSFATISQNDALSYARDRDKIEENPRESLHLLIRSADTSWTSASGAVLPLGAQRANDGIRQRLSPVRSAPDGCRRFSAPLSRLDE